MVPMRILFFDLLKEEAELFKIRIIFTCLLIGVLSISCSMEKLCTMKQRNRVHAYEQIDFHALVKRYLNKEESSVGEIEGIYSVSMLVNKKGKGILSSTEKEKISERKENYMQVAILKDTDSATGSL